MTWDHSQSLKELIRHVAYKVGGTPLLEAIRRRRGLSTTHLSHGTSEERFSAIYETGAWIEANGHIALSGHGSELTVTEAIRSALPKLLEELSCRKIVDVGCGDWNWMKAIPLPCDYVGLDIVRSVIESNRVQFARPGVEFEAIDAIRHPVPAADVVLCREVLFHLSLRDAISMLSNVRKSATYIIATSDPTIWYNSDIPTGDFRKINLQMSPFNFPAPAYVIRDDHLSARRILGVWSVSGLPSWR